MELSVPERNLQLTPTQPEKDRLDIFHKFFLVARRDVLHSAPLIPNSMPPRILDLGTGTGKGSYIRYHIPRPRIC